MAGEKSEKKPSTNIEGKSNLRVELDRLEKMIADLKISYEQYFTGVLPLPPDKQHKALKRKIRELFGAPFKNSALSFRLKSLDQRYQTLNNYWQRVLKQREEGTYSRDVFKAALRERIANEEAEADSEKGAADQHMRDLFRTYQDAIERATGRSKEIKYQEFKKSLVKRAKEYREKHGAKKLTFKVVVKDGAVKVQARAKPKDSE